MLRKFLFVVVALALVPTFAKADFKTGDFELTLGGSGASNKGLTRGGFGANGSLGYFLSKDIEIAVFVNSPIPGNNIHGITSNLLRQHLH